MNGIVPAVYAGQSSVQCKRYGLSVLAGDDRGYDISLTERSVQQLLFIGIVISDILRQTSRFTRYAYKAQDTVAAVDAKDLGDR